MPRLWDETIDAHREAVRSAIVDTTWTLVNEHGLLSVTMSQIAQKAGIGRATLYKYFPDVEAVLLAGHERHVAAHLHHLRQLRDRAGAPGRRLRAVLEAYACISFYRRQHATDELAALLHRGDHVDRAHQEIHDLLEGVLAEAAGAGEVRDDVPSGELATFCLHALAGASDLASEAAVGRLVTLTLAGLSPSR